ncbi:MAG: DUF4446 family protein [Armatimonadetes bacterium]|nr:DUF4446 family protein [Armatimonadota bacterium]
MNIVALVAAGVAVVAAGMAIWWARRAYMAAAAPHSRVLADLLARVEQGEVQRLPMLLRQLDQHLAAVDARLEAIHSQLITAVQKIGLVRYDADPDLGGRVSFVLALLDANDDGILLTSVYRLEDNRVYVREVSGGKVAHELSPEEARALDMALNEDLQRLRQEKRTAARQPGQDQRKEPTPTSSASGGEVA